MFLLIYGETVTMAQVAKTIKEIQELFAKAGLDYNTVRAQGFDSYQLAEIQKGLEAGVSVSDYLDPEMPWTEMEEYRLELEQGIDLSEYRKNGFSSDRLAQIREGLAANLDVSVYAKQEYFAEQMKEIREGLEKGLPVMFYKDPAYNYMQMAEIRMGLEQNVDISRYARPEIPYRKMHAVREVLAEGVQLEDETISRYEAGVIRQIGWAKKGKVDIMEYAADGYDADQLHEIRLAMLDHLKEFKKYINRQYRGESLKEIRLGVKEGLDVTRYASVDYSWEQMHEIRLGLEARVPTQYYEKPLYRAQQMREIRKGLEKGLDVSYYTSMVYSSKEMRIRRLAMQKVMDQKSQEKSIDEALRDVGQGINTSTMQQDEKMTEKDKIKTGLPFVNVTSDGLKAELYIPFKVGQEEYTVDRISDFLRKSNIIYGVDYNAIADLVEGKRYNRYVVIAQGKPAKPGPDGKYKYYFDTNVPSQPATMPDLSLLYDDVKFFEMVKVGDKIAEYTDAEFGDPGRTVRGDEIPAVKGREFPILKGQGIMMMEDKKSWCATLSGEIRIKDFVVTVRPLEVLDKATDPKATYKYPGSVLIEGNVTKGVTVKAKGDIVVRGKMDSARLDADGNICVAGGIMGSAERSLIRAGGRVSASSIIKTDIRAGTNINANDIKDSELVAGGRVSVAGQNGSIVGGETQAQLGVSCAVLGDASGRRTIVQVGATGELTAQYQNCMKSLSRITSELGLLKSEKERIAGLPNNAVKVQQQIKVGQALAIKESEENELTMKRLEMEDRMKAVAGAKARVTHIAYAGSIIIIDGIAKQLNSDMTKPSGLLFVNRGGGVSLSQRDEEG
ncbi:MAG: FapA family protein [Lachnospiraceae bacterium]|nr:FapA family protein [Lachnospiraceae bacterium]